MYQPIYTDLKNDPRAGKKRQKSTERRKTHTHMHTQTNRHIHTYTCLTHMSQEFCVGKNLMKNNNAKTLQFHH